MKSSFSLAILLLCVVSCLQAQNADPIKPPEQFLHDYAEYMKLNDEIARQQMKLRTKLHKKTDLMLGMAARLGQSVPQGYVFDPALKLFKPKPAPPTPAAGSPPPTPAGGQPPTPAQSPAPTPAGGKPSEELKQDAPAK